MILRPVFILSLLLLLAVPAFSQQKITITRVESLRAVPTPKVSRDQLELIPGTLEAPEDAKPMRPIPEYVYASRASRSMPMPTPNPLGVSFCELDIYPFEQ